MVRVDSRRLALLTCWNVQLHIMHPSIIASAGDGSAEKLRFDVNSAVGHEASNFRNFEKRNGSKLLPSVYRGTSIWYSHDWLPFNLAFAAFASRPFYCPGRLPETAAAAGAT